MPGLHVCQLLCSTGERERGKQILTRFNFQKLQPGILRGMQTPLFAPATCWIRVQLTWGQAWRLKAKNKHNHISVHKPQALSLASLFLPFQHRLVGGFNSANRETELRTQGIQCSWGSSAPLGIRPTENRGLTYTLHSAHWNQSCT